MDNGHILVVDDQREICDLVQEYLSSEGYYRVSTAQDGAGMRRVMAQSAIDLVILDLVLPGEDGLTLARSIRDVLSCCNCQGKHLGNSKNSGSYPNKQQQEGSMDDHPTISTESGSGSPALAFHPTLTRRRLLGGAGMAFGAVVTPLTDHPWGLRDFVIEIPGGHRLALGERIGGS